MENKNEQLQQVKVENLLQQEVVLLRKNMRLKDKIKFHEEQEYKNLVKNIRENRVPNIYKCIEVLLKEPYVDKKRMLTNLKQYRFLEDETFKIGPTIRSDMKKIESTLYFSKQDMPILLLMHEMNHLINYNLEIGKRVTTGFLQFCFDKNEVIEVGRGINEAFTEYLSTSLVNEGRMILSFENDLYRVGYPFGMQVAKILTNIIGEDKIKKMYYGKNPDELIDEFCHDMEEEKVIQFYQDMDYLIKQERENIAIKDSVFASIDRFLREFSIKRKDRDITKDINLEARVFQDGVLLPACAIEEAKIYTKRQNGGSKR